MEHSLAVWLKQGRPRFNPCEIYSSVSGIKKMSRTKCRVCGWGSNSMYHTSRTTNSTLISRTNWTISDATNMEQTW